MANMAMSTVEASRIRLTVWLSGARRAITTIRISSVLAIHAQARHAHNRTAIAGLVSYRSNRADSMNTARA